MTRKCLYLIDGMSHIYRAFYAIRNLSNSRGLPTNAVYGFTSMLRKLIHDERPDYLAVALDLEGPTVRHEKYEAYKATRKPMPEEMILQIPYIRRVCEAFRVPVIGLEGYEADDVIGTLTRMADEQGLSSVVVTSDKDMLQLVSENVRVLDPMKDNLVLDERKVLERVGVKPEQIPDLLGLWGDSSDNIPGAPGIGEKGAKELIQAYGSIEACLRNWDKVKRKTYQQSLRDNEEIIRMSRELATIRRDLPLELDLDTFALRDPDAEAAFALFAELEFKSLMQEFLQEPEATSLRAEWLKDEALKKFMGDLSKQTRIFVALRHARAPLGRKTADTLCIQGEKGEVGVVDLTEGENRREGDRLMSSPDVTKVCWDAKLALLALERCAVRLEANVEDVMLMAFLTAPNVGDYSLKRWALERLHVSLPNAGGGAPDLLSGQTRETEAEKLRLDLSALRRLYDELYPQMEAMGLTRIYREIELPFLEVLADMERTGIKVCRETLKGLSLEMEGLLSELTQKIYEAAGIEFNINSPKQLGEVLFERLNLPTLKKTRKTKGYSTDQAVLEELAHSYEIPRLILEYRQFAKLKSTYVDTLPGLINPDTGRIHTFYNQTGAATGRISSSDPNLQNIPVRTDFGRRIREAFVAEEGKMLVSADYSQIELRVLAHLCGDEVLIDAFRNDEDIHERTAREVFGDARGTDKAERRRMAKVINFGIVYGLSAFGLAQRLGIDREEAQAFIDSYFERYKSVRRWLDQTIEEARRTGQVRTLYGRVRQITDIHSKNYAARQFAERIAVNSPIQGTAADILKIAMVRIRKSLQDSNLSAKMLLQVHDELVLEAPRAEADDLRELVRHDMENAAVLQVPLVVDINAADNWKEMK